ncbi:MAG TPA: bifunctional DNA-formamidopyrimidine glycosylase/DNA-(apurinic or apyrimidinic site) lyase [Actinomycetales bacterium]|nr:bifunctional DNA-formamidopyrimidine glycosylase/DNA-(apurinic or apyrimidinic site) lyase [Actinomycetales bacterium]
MPSWSAAAMGDTYFMPELPEVETVRRGLERTVLDRPIAHVEVFHPRTMRRQPGGEQEFSDILTGATFIATARRGKFLWLPTAAGDAMLAHLGMSGQLLVVPPGGEDPKHLRARITFDDEGPELQFVDQRTFGYLMAERGGAQLPSLVAHIAPDPLDETSDEDVLVAALHRRGEIKKLLLDQQVISGIGNIYADEALWRAGIHGRTPGILLSEEKRRELLDHARQVLLDAIAAGGTSFDELYVGIDGEKGWFERSLDAYGRAGQACRRCGEIIVREKWGGRSSHWCPGCQVLPN